MQDVDEKVAKDLVVLDPLDVALPSAEQFGNPLAELSFAQDVTDYGSLAVPDQEEVLYGTSSRDVANAVLWLSEAPANVVVRITGGCLLMEPGKVEEIQRIVEEALEGYQGVLISGDSISVNAADPTERRPCMPEVGASVAANNPEARHLGVFPGESLVMHEDYIEIGQDLVDGTIWEIRAHERPGRRMAVQEPTELFWAAEREQIYEEILPALEEVRPPEVIAVIGFDGGPETLAEYKQVAALSLADPRYHLFLIEGGEDTRATDSLINDKEFLLSHPNVHVVPKNLSQLKAALSRFGVHREG